ncbi:MAG: Unknown protein [uncultured Sulfurovum sp.]|uniref:Uncharacterized protein n=1 Tax=uncultured Sulfurovum sp. TaxID=269237 RepID=A0A6S6TKB2_9BACT|nr:MAG: Unknown protein [uncultured Sulfurovum sp.]
MQTLHLRAENGVLEKVLEMLNQFSLKGEKIEIIDNLVYENERGMILKALSQEKKGETIEHDILWDELLK